MKYEGESSDRKGVTALPMGVSASLIWVFGAGPYLMLSERGVAGTAHEIISPSNLQLGWQRPPPSPLDIPPRFFGERRVGSPGAHSSGLLFSDVARALQRAEKMLITSRLLLNSPPLQDPRPSTNPDETLSDHLDRNKGVIKPPPTGDAGMETTVPNPDPGTTIVNRRRARPAVIRASS